MTGHESLSFFRFMPTFLMKTLSPDKHDINHLRYFLYFLRKVHQSFVVFCKNVSPTCPQVVVSVVSSLQFLSQDHYCRSRSVL